MRKNNLVRGKSVSSKTWVQGYYVLLQDAAYIYTGNTLEDGTIERIEVDATSIGQALDTTDMHDKPIFELDLVQDEYGYIWQVIWDTTKQQFALIDNSKDVTLAYTDVTDALLVIGNSIDNQDWALVKDDAETELDIIF